MAGDDSTGSSGNAVAGNAGAGGRSFTEADVERIVRDRLDRERRKQEEAVRAAQDSSKSDVDKLTAAVTALTERAAKSEAALARRDVAEKYNLPKNIAAKLTGTDEADLDREARDWVTQLAELGVPVKDGKIVGKQAGGAAGGGNGSAGGDGNGGQNAGGSADGTAGQGGGDGENGGGQSSTGGDGGSAGSNGSSNGQQAGGDAGKGRSLLSGRPTENLKSGAGAAGGSTSVDADKLADSILNRGF